MFKYRTRPELIRILPYVNSVYIILAVIIRIIKINYITHDTYTFVLPWYRYLEENGLSQAYSSELINYTPPYLYLLCVSTLIKFVPDILAIKIISMIFDFIAAIMVFKIIKMKYQTGILCWLGFFIVLFAPVVFLQSSVWGQCDIIYSTFLLCSLYFILKRKHVLSILSFSIAFTFKLQAIFFAPLFLIFVLHKRINPLWLFAPILVYFLAMTPAWIAGNSFLSLLTIYVNQYDTYKSLSMNAPNPYAFIQSQSAYQTIVTIGIVITFIVSFTYIIYRWKIFNSIKNNDIVFDALFFTFIIPFVLPKMHERYFFPAGLFIIILAFYNHKYVVAAILLHFSSTLSYLPFLLGYSYIYVQAAAILNFVLLIYLLVFMIKNINLKRTERLPILF